MNTTKTTPPHVNHRQTHPGITWLAVKAAHAKDAFLTACYVLTLPALCAAFALDALDTCLRAGNS